MVRLAKSKLALFTVMIAIPNQTPVQAGFTVEHRIKAERTTNVYRCKNRMTLGLTFMAIDKLPLIKLTHPSERSRNKSRNLLLPQSQSGSGVRYATDLVSVHLKNDELMLRSKESAMTDEIAAVRCTKI